jgi:RND family efflux transporter MFP subunit
MTTTNRITNFLLVMGAVSVASCAKPPGLPPKPAEVTVQTVVAQARTVKRVQLFPGTTASVHPVKISARVTGFLEQAHVTDGAVVKAGDLLYTIDQQPFQATLDQAKGTLAQANAQVLGSRAARDLSQRDVDRNRALADSGAVSKQSFDQMTSKLEQADAQLSAAEAAVVTATAQVETATLNLSYCKVTAPAAGLLGKSLAFQGQMVGPGYTVELNDLVQLDPMWAEFSPSATQWPEISAILAKGDILARIGYGGAPSIQAEGKVSFTANQVDKSTSTLMMRVTFTNPGAIFRPGTFVDVSLDLGEIPNVVMIPTSALVARETDFFVWRVKGDGSVENVRVKAATREENLVGISSGLSAGDRIVAVGTQKLRDGSKIVEDKNTSSPVADAVTSSAEEVTTAAASVKFGEAK